MDWVASIHQAIQYIEQHLREELTIQAVSYTHLDVYKRQAPGIIISSLLSGFGFPASI